MVPSWPLWSSPRWPRLARRMSTAPIQPARSAYAECADIHRTYRSSAAEEPLGDLRVRAGAAQADTLVAWAAAWPGRTWAVEGAGGLGRLLAQQLAAAGERVLDVPPRLAARVRLLQAGDTNKNDP